MVSLSGNGIPTGAYVWDDRDHLTSQTSGGVTTNYGYSAGGMRVWSQTGSNPKTFYLFDGGLLLGELNAGTPIAAYTWGASGLVSERLADSAGSLASGTSLWYAYGPQGETRQLTDATGAVVDSYLYTSYGVPVSATNNARNPFRYGGQAGYYSDLSTTSGNILCTNRWYNPAISRWLSRDPIGYSGGVNLYEYCLSNPTHRIDPTGTEPPLQLFEEAAKEGLEYTKALLAALETNDTSLLPSATIAATGASAATTGVSSILGATVTTGAAGAAIITAPFAVAGGGLYYMGQSLNSTYAAEAKAYEQPQVIFHRRFSRNKNKELTDGVYTVDAPAMEKHTNGKNACEKSQFLYGLDSERISLIAARRADIQNLWTPANKAKVNLGFDVGIHGTSGLKTTWVNVYRNAKSGRIHSAPSLLK